MIIHLIKILSSLWAHRKLIFEAMEFAEGLIEHADWLKRHWPVLLQLWMAIHHHLF